MMRFGGGHCWRAGGTADRLPMVLWHSKMLESGDFVTAEFFGHWCFDKFMDRARVLLDTLKFRTMAETAIEDEEESRGQ